jgi:mannosyltransferase
VRVARPAVQAPRYAPAALTATRARVVSQYWPLALLIALAAIVRFATLDQQSLWYDESVTAVRVLHASLHSTLSAVVHVENTPPLYYVVAWGWTRALGTGVLALRSLSALAGVGARGVARGVLFFLRARGAPTRRNLAAWAACSTLALLTHYFAAFLIAAQAPLLLRGRRADRRTWAALGAVAATGVALIPLISAQGGRGTGWISNWPLGGRLGAIAKYYLLGESGAPLGGTILLLAALPILAALALAPALNERERAGVRVSVAVGGFAVLAPVALKLAGVDYFTPRYLVAAYVPLSAALALVLAAQSRRIGAALAVLICTANLLVVAAVDTRPQLQRGDWSGVAEALRAGPPQRAVVIAVIGATPLQYYEPQLAQVSRAQTVRVREIDLVGYPPLRAGATRPPAAGFSLIARTTIHGIVVLRFGASNLVSISGRRLLSHRPVLADSQALASAQASGQ